VRAHVFPVAAICAASDAVLIAAGVAGFGALTGALPWLETAMRWVGAAFLLWYGLRSWRAAWRGEGALRAGAAAGSLRAAVLTCLALTWLNPHVYLDTVMLLGAVSAQYEDRTGFALGAMAASVLFFFTLAYAGRLLAPVFARPAAWRVLDLGIGAVMLALAARLASGQ